MYTVGQQAALIVGDKPGCSHVEHLVIRSVPEFPNLSLSQRPRFSITPPSDRGLCRPGELMV